MHRREVSPRFPNTQSSERPPLSPRSGRSRAEVSIPLGSFPLKKKSWMSQFNCAPRRRATAFAAKWSSWQQGCPRSGRLASVCCDGNQPAFGLSSAGIPNFGFSSVVSLRPITRSISLTRNRCSCDTNEIATPDLPALPVLPMR